MTTAGQGMTIRVGHRLVTPAAVLETFAGFQPRTDGMIVEQFGIDRHAAEALLDEPERWGELTMARAGTEVPVWLRPYRPRERR